MKKHALLLSALLLVIVAPACRKTKHVEEPREEEALELYEEIRVERVSGPAGWNLNDEDLK